MCVRLCGRFQDPFPLSVSGPPFSTNWPTVKRSHNSPEFQQEDTVLELIDSLHKKRPGQWSEIWTHNLMPSRVIALPSPEAIDILLIGASLGDLPARTRNPKSRSHLSRTGSPVANSCQNLQRYPKHGKGVFDLGARWINDTTASQTFALAEILFLKVPIQTIGNDELTENRWKKSERLSYGCLLVVGALRLTVCHDGADWTG